jgi:hypothetical protein
MCDIPSMCRLLGEEKVVPKGRRASVEVMSMSFSLFDTTANITNQWATKHIFT